MPQTLLIIALNRQGIFMCRNIFENLLCYLFISGMITSESEVTILKVVITTNIEYETRLALDEYCKKKEIPLTQVIDEAIQNYLVEKGA